MSRNWLWRPVALLAITGASAMLLSAQQTTSRTALPGTVNYVEGQASVDGTSLSTKQDGKIQVQPNQSLTTANGKVEMLLSPGVFVRVGENSDVRLVSNGIVNPTIDVTRGEAMVEVDNKPHDEHLSVLEHGATASILKAGLYWFNEDQNRIAVLDGKLKVTVNDQTKEFGKGHELLLNDPTMKTSHFDVKAHDDLYAWSSVRSSYLAEANQATAQNVYMGSGPWWGAGWYWSPYFATWSWLPGDGSFYSPFGYPFYSPGFAVYGGGFYGGQGIYANRGFVPRGTYRGFAGGAFHGSPAIRGGGGFRGGFAGGGVRAGGGHR
jgi:hypothetical protein